MNNLSKTTYQTVGRLLLLTAVIAALNGCASQRDGEARVTPLTAAQLGLPAGNDQAAFRSDWWRALNDPQLNQLMEQALAGNPTMDMAAARIRSAEAIQRLNASADGPFVDGNASFQRERNSLYNPMFPPPLGGGWFNLNTVQLTLDYSFDFWGRTRHQVEAAVGQRLAAQTEAYDVRLIVETGVASQYLEWLAAAEARDIAVQQRKQSEAQFNVAKVRARSGLTGAEAPANADATLAQLRQRESYATARYEQALHGLAALTGQGPHALDNLKPRAMPDWRLPTASLTTNLLAYRPDVQASLWRAQSAAAMVKSAKAEFYPDLSISALIGQSAEHISDLFKYESLTIAMMPAINLPIFHAGQLNANLGARSADYDLAVAQYNQTLLSAARDAADRLSTLNAAQKADADAQQGLAAEQRRHRSVESRYRSGLIGREPWLQSQQMLDNARLTASEARASRLSAQVALVHALGGNARNATPNPALSLKEQQDNH